MKKFILLLVAMTAICFSSFSNPLRCLKSFPNYGVYPAINDSTTEIHWKTNEYEMFLYKGGNYRINYVDSTFSVGQWTISDKVVTFQKDIKKSTSTKVFLFNKMTEKEYNEIFGEKIKKNEIDPYPLLMEKGK